MLREWPLGNVPATKCNFIAILPVLYLTNLCTLQQMLPVMLAYQEQDLEESLIY